MGFLGSEAMAEPQGAAQALARARRVATHTVLPSIAAIA